MKNLSLSLRSNSVDFDFTRADSVASVFDTPEVSRVGKKSNQILCRLKDWQEPSRGMRRGRCA